MTGRERLIEIINILTDAEIEVILLTCFDHEHSNTPETLRELDATAREVGDAIKRRLGS